MCFGIGQEIIQEITWGALEYSSQPMIKKLVRDKKGKGKDIYIDVGIFISPVKTKRRNFIFEEFAVISAFGFTDYNGKRILIYNPNATNPIKDTYK